jgi:hypothetical protein
MVHILRRYPMVKKELEIWCKNLLFPNPRSHEISPHGHSPLTIDVQYLTLNILCFDISEIDSRHWSDDDRRWTFLYQPMPKPFEFSPCGFVPLDIDDLHQTFLYGTTP